MAFWHRFVFPHRDRLELGEANAVLEQEVCPALDGYLSRVVEPPLGALCRTAWRHLLPFEPEGCTLPQTGSEIRAFARHGSN